MIKINLLRTEGTLKRMGKGKRHSLFAHFLARRDAWTEWIKAGLTKPCDIRPDAFGKGGCDKPRVDGLRFCEYHTKQAQKAALGRRSHWA